MKRKALLLLADCTAKFFETCSARDFLPFAIGERQWSDYTLENAFQLRLLQLAFKGTDLDSAAMIARRAVDALYPLNPFSYTEDEGLWVALIRYEWPEAPEGWDMRQVVAGRMQDVHAKADEFVQDLGGGAKLVSIYAIPLKPIAHQVFGEARDLGIPEGEAWPQPPQDLTGFPEWFTALETSRRSLISSFGKAE
jgi:hypothetical protein